MKFNINSRKEGAVMKDKVSSIDHVLDKIVKEGERDDYYEPQLSENALTVLKKRYLLKDENRYDRDHKEIL